MHKFAFKTMQQRMIRERKFPNTDVDERSPLISNEVRSDEPVVKQGGGHVFLNIFKSIVGAGAFALPRAYMAGGLWGAVICTVVAAILCDYSMKVLIRTKIHMKFEGSYTELMHAGFGRAVMVVCYVMIVVATIGACTVYLVFCGNLLKNAFQIDATIPILLMSVVLAVASWVRSLRNIAFFSLLGDISLFIAMAVVLIYGFTHFEIKPLDHYPSFEWKTISQTYSAVIFLMGIHTIIVPIHNEMLRPQSFEFILSMSLIVVVLTNMSFGLLAFLLFDDQTSAPITNSLCEPFHYFVQIAAVALCGDLLFTFTIVFVAGRDVVESSLFNKSDVEFKTHVRRCAVRTAMVAICALLAVLLADKFGSLIDLIAGTTASATCFVLPPALYLHKLWPDEFRSGTNTKWHLFTCAINVFIIIVGIVAGVVTTIQAFENLIAPSPPSPCVHSNSTVLF